MSNHRPYKFADWFNGLYIVPCPGLGQELKEIIVNLTTEIVPTGYIIKGDGLIVAAIVFIYYQLFSVEDSVVYVTEDD